MVDVPPYWQSEAARWQFIDQQIAAAWPSGAGTRETLTDRDISPQRLWSRFIDQLNIVAAAGGKSASQLPFHFVSDVARWSLVGIEMTDKLEPGAVTTPPSGMTLWADFTDISTLFSDAGRTTPASAGGSLQGVTDKSGAGNHFTGVNTVRDTVKGALFDGSSAYMYADGFAGALSGASSKAWTLAIVTEAATEALGTARSTFSAGNSANTTAYASLATASSRFQMTRSGASSVSSDAGVQTVGKLNYWIVCFYGANYTVWKNGFAQVLNAAITTGTMTVNQFTLGARRRSVIDQFFNGKIHEVIGYNSALDYETGIKNLDAYIRYKHLGEAQRIPALAVITAGQSLMCGRATPYSSTPAVPNGAAFEVDYQTVTIGDDPIANPVGFDAKSSNTGGYLPQWAKKWNELTGQVPFIINVAVGGTGLQPQSSAQAANGNWSSLYTTDAPRLADTLRLRSSFLHSKLSKSPRYNYVDQGVTLLWDQWNNDGAQALNETANAYTIDGVNSRGGYTAELVALVDYVKNNNGGTPTPVKRFHIIEAGAHSNYTSTNDEPSAVVIRNAQADAAALINNGFVASRLAKTFGELGYYMPDTIHYNATGNNILGPDAATNGAANRASEVAADAIVRVSLLRSTVRVTEAGSNVVAKFLLLRHNNTADSCSVDWAVSGSGASPASAADFVGGAFPSGTVSFAAGERIKMISVNILGDAVSSEEETFTVSLTNPVGCALTAFQSAIGTISDSGAPPPSLGSLALDVGTANVDVPWSSAIVGATTGSTITITSSTGDAVTVTGTTASATFTTLPAVLTITETLAGASNTPRLSNATVTSQEPTTALPSTNIYNNLDWTDRSTLFQDTARTVPVTAKGDVVMGVADKSGNARHATGVGNPVLSTLYGRDAVNLNGSSQYYRCDAIATLIASVASQGAIHIAVKNTKSSASILCAWSGSHTSGSGRRALLIDSTSNAASFQTRDNASTTTSVALGSSKRGTTEIWSFRKQTDGTIDVYCNGTLIADNVATTAAATSIFQFVIGARWSTGNTADAFHLGLVGQLVSYSTQTDAEFLQAHQHLREKFGA